MKDELRKKAADFLVSMIDADYEFADQRNIDLCHKAFLEVERETEKRTEAKVISEIAEMIRRKFLSPSEKNEEVKEK